MAPWYLGPFLVCLLITYLYSFWTSILSDSSIRSTGSVGLHTVSLRASFEALYPKYLRPRYTL